MMRRPDRPEPPVAPAGGIIDGMDHRPSGTP